MEDKECFSEDLKCFWRSIHVAGKNRIRIDMLRGNCTDMRGAIRVATALMPEVTRIDTYSGIDQDTYYVLGEDGKWVANTQPRRQWQREM